MYSEMNLSLKSETSPLLLDTHKRIEITLSPSNNIIPFDYQSILSDSINKLLNINSITDSNSLHSFSWLRTAPGATYEVIADKGFVFNEGAKLNISSYDLDLIDDFLDNIADNPEYAIIADMTVQKVEAVETPEFKSKTRLFLNSPTLVKKTVDGVVKHLSYENSEASIYMSNTIKAKMESAGIEGDAFLRFDTDYHKSKMKLVKMDGIMNKCSICPIIVEASSPQVVEFIWAVGVGHLTGAGFGSVM